MKRVVFAIVVLLLATSAFAQGSLGPIWYTSDKVAIGNTNPFLRFEVEGGGAGEGLGFINRNTGGLAYMTFAESGGGSTPFWIARWGSTAGSGLARSAEIWMAESSFIRLGTSNTERIRIDSAGRVGIGTSSPAQMLDVNGNINVSGNINAKYQDVAEWVPSDGTLDSGTVVVLNPEQANHVIESTTPYDTTVAGVISERPGLLLGESGSDKSKVATTGRVKVKVDATKHPVKIGDLLVTSDLAGYAMRSEPVKVGEMQMHRPGTIIGKALEPLPSGRGEILVLLSLN